MKTLNIIFLFFVSTLLLTSAGCKTEDPPIIPPPAPLQLGSGEMNGYKLIWEDLFDATTLNKQNWTVEENGNGGGNNELQYYKKENITLEREPSSNRNCLVITAKKENYQGKTATSGRLNSNGKITTIYGKIEALIKFPSTANGLWPAFWLMGNDWNTMGWPKCGEIDIVEMGHINGINSGTQNRHLIAACHWGEVIEGGHPNYALEYTHNANLQNDFHLYTIIWDSESVSMFLDLDKNPSAQPYYKMNISDVSQGNSPGHFFHKPFFILFNLAVGGNFPAIWNINQATALNNGNAKMWVDYVKVYQK